MFKECGLNYYSFSKFRNAMFGFAAIWIVLFHGVQLDTVHFEGGSKMLYDILMCGNIGVDVFIFLSGIGLYFAYSKKPPILKFYGKRFLRVYLPYLLLVSPYIIDIYINKKIEADALWQALLTVNFWTGKAPSVDFWYISVILAFYLLYPLIHKFIFHDRLFFKKREPLLSSSACEFIRMLILVVLSVGLAVFLFYVFSDAYKTVDRAVSRLTIFIFGCYIGKFVKEKKRFSFVWILFALVIVAGMLPVYRYRNIYDIIYRYYGSLVGVALTYLLSQLFVILSYIKIDKVFVFFGTFSLEIYIFTILARKIFYDMPQCTGECFGDYCLFMLPAIILAFFFNKAFNVLFFPSKLDKTSLQKTNR